MRNKIPHLFPLVNLKIKDNIKGFSRGKQKLVKENHAEESHQNPSET